MNMQFETLKTGMIEEGIGEIVINRPKKLNALDSLVLSELISAFEQYAKEDKLRVLIFRGEGNRSFIAGADIEEMSKMGPLEFREYTLKLRTMTKLMIGYEKPIIAAVKGYAFGGGNILAMHCDFVFATQSSSFGQQEIALGILGGVARLIFLVGNRRAWDLVMTGRTINAQEAEAIGLITRCLPEEGFDEFVMSYARKLRSNPAVATKLAKALKSISEKVNLEAAYEYENELISLCFASTDIQERMQNFIAKNRPRTKENKNA
jgi:enoyl-CoA hydratase/carnithine racemase